MVFGSRFTAKSTYEYFATHPGLGLRPIGIVDNLNPPKNGNGQRHAKGKMKAPSFAPDLLKKAKSVIDETDVFWAIVIMPKHMEKRTYSAIEKRISNFPHVVVIPDSNGFPSPLESELRFGMDFRGFL